jgi:glycosyltransferase involved in cell wall biosynthesis
LNEALILPGWLEAHTGLADEFLVVDTGSTDGSIDIGRAWGANVIEQEMSGGFGFIRSFCIERASCEWVIILDADERIYRHVPEFMLKEEPTEIDMTTKWPSGPGAPTHCKYEAIGTGRYIDQHFLARQATDDPNVIGYRTRRRHWFDWDMKRPCQNWMDWVNDGGIPDWQARFVKTGGVVDGQPLRYVRKVHEWLRDHSGREPANMGAFGPDGPFFDHFHVPAKGMIPGRSEDVTAFSTTLYESDDEWKETY